MLNFTEGGASFSKLTSSQNASREDADEEETESFFEGDKNKMTGNTAFVFMNFLSL